MVPSGVEFSLHEKNPMAMACICEQQSHGNMRAQCGSTLQDQELSTKPSLNPPTVRTLKVQPQKPAEWMVRRPMEPKARHRKVFELMEGMAGCSRFQTSL